MKTIVKPIEMNSVTDLEGIIRPIRFRIAGKDEELHVIKVLKIYKIEELRISGVMTRVYTCEVQIEDSIRICELRYRLDTTKWDLYKI
jgi:hypothetical protein